MNTTTQPAHTAEPWSIDDQSDLASAPYRVVYLQHAGEGENEGWVIAAFRGPQALENAKRAQVCVNALAGCNPDAVAGLIACAEEEAKQTR